MNLSRASKIMMWNLIGTRFKIVRDMMLVAIAFFFFAIMNLLPAFYDGAMTYNRLGGAISIINFFSVFYLLKKASDVCFNMKQKTDFVTYAMLPATKFEKFIVNVIYQTVLQFAMIIVALALADLLQYALSMYFCENAFSLIATYTEGLFTLEFLDFISIILVCLFIQSTFILGGCFFRNHPMLFTMLVWLLVPFVLTMLVAALLTGLKTWAVTNNYHIYIEPIIDINTTESIFCLVVLALTALNYCISFFFFRRLQIINNKFFN